MSAHRDRSLYPFLVWPFFLAGTVLNALILCSYLDLFSFEPFTQISSFMRERDADELLILFFLAGAGLLLLSALVYAFSLDPFRAERPGGLVYLNFFPLAMFVGVVAVTSSMGGRRVPSLLQAAAGVSLSFLLPLIPLAIESALSRVLLGLGRFFDERDWRGPAFFCLKNSLRWRPGVHETARRCGLLLVEMGRFKVARPLLERIAPIAASEDFEVLHALEQLYTTEGMSNEALETIKRQRALRPHARGIDQRFLKQCLALDRKEDAIEVLESGRVPLDIEMLFILQDLYTKTGNVAQALSRARQIANLESPPYPRSIALHRELLAKMPGSLDLKIDLGMLLQKTGNPDQMKEGAVYLEEALDRDPRRLHLRRQLAHYYLETMQHERAEVHYTQLIEGGDIDPETYLEYADILKSEKRLADAREVYRKMQSVCDGDWRGFFEEASALFQMGELEAAESAIDRGFNLVPESEAPKVNQLRKKLQKRREEIQLQELSKELESNGTDFQKRFDYVRQLLAMGRGDRVIAECDEMLEEKPALLPEVEKLLEEGVTKLNSYRLRDYLADLYFRQERYDDSLSQFEQMAPLAMDPAKSIEEGCRRILTRAPLHLKARMRLMEIYRETENWEGILQSLTAILDNPPEEAAVRIKAQWVEAAYHAGKLKEAMEIGMDLLEDKRDDPDYLILMIRVLEDNGQYNQAYELFKVAYELYPDNETLQQMEKTVADNKTRNRMEVLQEMERKGQLTPALHYEKADLHREFGQTQFAMVHYQRAADDAVLHDVAMAKLAVCLCERRMFELANETLDSIELTKEGVSERRELKGLFYQVADVLEYERYYPEAVKYYKRIFRVDASYRDVMAKLERLGEG